jgi:hypothetical protein
MAKGLRVGMNRDLVQRSENALLKVAIGVNRNIDELRKEVAEVKAAQDLFYETFMARTLGGRWLRFKKWIGGKK